VKTYNCSAGSCDPSSQFVTGDACDWLVVSGVSGLSRAKIVDQSNSTGDICMDNGDVGSSTTINGTVVSTALEDDALTFGQNGVVLNDIVSNFTRVKGANGVTLPGLPPGTNSVAAGLVVAKSNGGFYNTTGADPRVLECQMAQADILSASSAILGLASTQSLGVIQPGGSTTVNINASVVGGLNVIDITKMVLGNDVTVNISGGGNPNTVVVLRIANQLDVSLRSRWNLTNGLTTRNFLIYADGGRCEIGGNGIGSGTILCPNAKVFLNNNTVWDGQALGDSRKVQVGDAVTFTYVPFTGF
jgi:hypothetical protein